MDMMYKKVILKLSGEAIADGDSFSILSPKKVKDIVLLIKKLYENNVKVGVVIELEIFLEVELLKRMVSIM